MTCSILLTNSQISLNPSHYFARNYWLLLYINNNCCLRTSDSCFMDFCDIGTDSSRIRPNSSADVKNFVKL